MKQSSSSSFSWCTNNLLLLPISGAFVVLLGILLIILLLVTRGLTTSLYLVEGAVPSYISAIVIILSGILTALLYVKPVQSLIVVVFISSISCIVLCLVQIVTIAVISVPFLSSFTACVHKPSTLECQCYIFNSRQNNSFIADDTSNHHVFKGASTCPSIQKTLKDFLYIICIVYVFALVACLFTALLSVLLWCRHQSSSAEATDCERRPQGEQRATASSDPSTSAAAPPSQPSSGHFEEGPVESRENEQRPASNRPTDRVQRRQRSSSVSSSQPSPARHVQRHHSLTAADTRPPERPQRNRQRPPPVLTRGGYLQSQLNGPTIPVYTLQGTNEVYISLTDLPTLQMPSLESVPAFIPELPEPDDDPPPYSPAEEVHLTDILPSIHRAEAYLLEEVDTVAIAGAVERLPDEGDGLDPINANGAYVNEGACLNGNGGDDLTGHQGSSDLRNALQDGRFAFNGDMTENSSSSEMSKAQENTLENTSKIAKVDPTPGMDEDTAPSEHLSTAPPVEAHNQRKHDKVGDYHGLESDDAVTLPKELPLHNESDAEFSDGLKRKTTQAPPNIHPEGYLNDLGRSNHSSSGATHVQLCDSSEVAVEKSHKKDHMKKDGNNNLNSIEDSRVQQGGNNVSNDTDLVNKSPKGANETAGKSSRDVASKDVNGSRNVPEYFRKLDDPDSLVRARPRKDGTDKRRDGFDKRREGSRGRIYAMPSEGHVDRDRKQRRKQQIIPSSSNRGSREETNTSPSRSWRRERSYNESGAKPKTNRRNNQKKPGWVERCPPD